MTANNRFEGGLAKQRFAAQHERYRAEQSSAFLAGWKSPSGKD
jgi:hypothetical protein